MARPLRIEYPGAWYHVMNRGRRREKIFFDDIDYENFLEILESSHNLFEFEIHAYSLMSNHYHCLVRTPRGNLSRAMRHLDGVYTQKFNRRHKCEGALFRGRYKAILVDEDTYVMELARYIHRNPTKAGAEHEPGQHKWTSHRAYLELKPKITWLKKDHVLKYFGVNRTEAVKRFDAFVKERTDTKLETKMSSLNWPAILGSTKFKERVKRKFLGKRLDEKNVPQLRQVFRDRTINDLQSIAKELWKINPVVWQKVRRGYDNPKRRALIYVSRRHLKATANEIRDSFGQIGYAAISMQYKRALSDIDNEEGCYHDVCELEKAIN